LKTNFLYTINADGTATFSNVPKIAVKSHRWRKNAEGVFEIVNGDHCKFLLLLKSEDELVISKVGRAEFDFHNVGKNLPERVLVKVN
jgi:hypothetical protein